jgi:hypothetical protein
MKKLVSEGGLKPDQLSGLYDFIEDRSINKDVFKLKATNNELDRDEIRIIRNLLKSKVKLFESTLLVSA